MNFFRVLVVLTALISSASLALPCFAEATVTSTASQTLSSPVGYWQTIDDKTGKVKSIVKLFTYQNKLYGRIMQINYQPGHGPADLCTQCEGVRQTQAILGMVFLWDLVPDPAASSHWIDGQILDPKVGAIYSSEVTLMDNGQRLQVLGYKGSTMFGRTQTWRRVSATSLQAFPAAMVATGTDLAAVQTMPQ